MANLTILSFILPVMMVFRLILAMPPPGPPLHLSVVSDVDNIGVQWEAPAEIYGNIRNYIVSWAVLPNFTDSSSIVGGNVTMSIISARGMAGLLFRIRVRAENEGGIGPYTLPKYIRIGCGNIYSLFPGNTVSITSPGFQAGVLLQPGILCTWTIKTLVKYSLDVFFDQIKLSGSADSNDCLDSYIDISGIGRLCNGSYTGHHVRTDLQTLKLTLKTGRNSGGQGIRITVKSVVLLPGSPINIKLRTSDHAVIISWHTPREKTLPITAYRIRYGVIAQKNHFLINVGQNMRFFAINTNKFEGKLLEIYLSAVIGMDEGKMSEKYFARAPCRRRIHLNDTNSHNITSPGYPRAYPSNIICTWYITSESNVMSSVTYLDFRLEDKSFCSSDYVTFSFKENTENECSRMKLPKTIETNAQNFTVTFVTDNQNEFPGFFIQIKSEVVSTRKDASTTEVSATKVKIMDDSSRKLKSTADILMTSSIAVKYTSSSWPPTASVKTAIKDVIPTTDSTNSVFTGHYYSWHLTQTTTDLSTIPSSTHKMMTTTYDHGETVQNTSNVSSAYHAEHLVSNSISSSSKAAEKGSGDDNDYSIVLAVILSMMSCVAVLFIALCYVRWRRRHGRMKINVETAEKNRATNIELHDILRNPAQDGSQYSNYRACVSDNNTKTVFAKRYLETIPEHPEDCLQNVKYMKKTDRKRHYSFPFCLSARRRKIHKEIQNSLTSFGFIEDKQALEMILRRKYTLRRTNSF